MPSGLGQVGCYPHVGYQVGKNHSRSLYGYFCEYEGQWSIMLEWAHSLWRCDPVCHWLLPEKGHCLSFDILVGAGLEDFTNAYIVSI